MENEKKKFISGDDMAKENLEIQMSLSKKSRFSNILLIVLTLGFIYTFAVLFWVMPDDEYSYNENRPLQQMPEISLDNLLSGQLTSDVSVYMADQFPFRDFFVGVKAVGEVAQVKLQNNDVILGSDGYLVARNDYPDADGNLLKNMSGCGPFQKALEERGIPCVAAFAGRKIDVCPELVPSVYGTYASDRIWEELDEAADANSLSYVNLRNILSQKEANGESLYYKTDHHWNSLGAYYAYCEVMKAFGETPYDITDFTKESVTDSFFGTTWSSSGIKWAEADTIDYYRWDGDEDFTMRVLDAGKRLAESLKDVCEVEYDGDYAVFDSYFVRGFLEMKDKYASFIGGNFGYTEIRKNGGEERETILLLKDSFSHSMVQFLARHYDIVLVDLRYYSGNIIELCENLGISRVLLLYNMETLTEAADLRALQIGTH